MAKKTRIDRLLVDLKLAPSRERAQALVVSGAVLVNDVPVQKPSESFDPEIARIRLRDRDRGEYVSRAAHKLLAAFEAFPIEISSAICCDIGASTGGFTQVLLEKGAARVYAIDVGHNQLDWILRNDQRVVVKEKVNARSLDSSIVPEACSLVTMDLAFISVQKVIPAVKTVTTANAKWIILVKPQFELDKGDIGKGGIVREAELHQKALDQTQNFLTVSGFEILGKIPSPVKGKDGNQEFLIYCQQRSNT